MRFIRQLDEYDLIRDMKKYLKQLHCDLKRRFLIKNRYISLQLYYCYRKQGNITNVKA